MAKFDLYIAVRRSLFEGRRQPVQWLEASGDRAYLLKHYPWPDYAVYPLLLDTIKTRRVKLEREGTLKEADDEA